MSLARVSITKAFPLPKCSTSEGQALIASGLGRVRAVLGSSTMKQTASAEGIISLAGFACACAVHFSYGFLRDNVLVVVATAILLSLGDLVLRAPGALEVFAGGLPV